GDCGPPARGVAAGQIARADGLHPEPVRPAISGSQFGRTPARLDSAEWADDAGWFPLDHGLAVKTRRRHWPRASVTVALLTMAIAARLPATGTAQPIAAST